MRRLTDEIYTMAVEACFLQCLVAEKHARLDAGRVCLDEMPADAMPNSLAKIPKRLERERTIWRFGRATGVRPTAKDTTTILWAIASLSQIEARLRILQDSLGTDYPEPTPKAMRDAARYSNLSILSGLRKIARTSAASSHE